MKLHCIFGKHFRFVSPTVKWSKILQVTIIDSRMMSLKKQKKKILRTNYGYAHLEGKTHEKNIRWFNAYKMPYIGNLSQSFPWNPKRVRTISIWWFSYLFIFSLLWTNFFFALFVFINFFRCRLPTFNQILWYCDLYRFDNHDLLSNGEKKINLKWFAVINDIQRAKKKKKEEKIPTKCLHPQQHYTSSVWAQCQYYMWMGFLRLISISDAENIKIIWIYTICGCKL